MVESSFYKSSQVRDRVADWIRKGNFLPGSKLPSERKMAKDLAMNNRTIRRGLESLVSEGLLVKQPRLGTFVAGPVAGSGIKTIQIGLFWAKAALKLGTQHPLVGATLIGASQRCPTPEFMIQPIFFDSPLVDNVGPATLENLSGLFVMQGQLTERDVAFLRERRIPAVRFSFEPCSDGWTIAITNDEPLAMTLLVEHLRSLGHERIGFICYSDTRALFLHRCFARLAFDHQLGDPNELVVPVTATGNEFHWEDVERFFSIKPLPSGVIVHDEFIVDVLLNGCQRRGIRVPQNLSVTAVHDSRPLGHLIPVTATVTDADMIQLAYTGCDLLVRRISGQTLPENFVKIPPKLTVKASTGPAAKTLA